MALPSSSLTCDYPDCPVVFRAPDGTLPDTLRSYACRAGWTTDRIHDRCPAHPLAAAPGPINLRDCPWLRVPLHRVRGLFPWARVPVAMIVSEAGAAYDVYECPAVSVPLTLVVRSAADHRDTMVDFTTVTAPAHVVTVATAVLASAEHVADRALVRGAEEIRG